MTLIFLLAVVVLMVCGVVAIGKMPLPAPAGWILQVVVILVGAVVIASRMGWLHG